jgi:Protein of unknown function (DUF3237)
MAENFSMRGEKIFEFDLDVTSVTDYGVGMDAILSGREKIPPQGARFDVAFDGRSGGRLLGRVRGVDYLWARADWRVDLDIRATIETDDGHRIALSGDGVAAPRPGEPMADLIENLCLNTAAEGYAWVNTRLIWGVGTVNLAARKIYIEGYLQ